MNSKNTPAFRIWHALVRLAVGVVGLLALRAIVLRLPMLKDITFSFVSLSFAELSALVALTAIFVLVYVFARQLTNLVGDRGPSALVLGQLGEYALLLLIVVLAYTSYHQLAEAILLSQMWIYGIAFIVLGILPVVGIAVVTYRNLDMLTASLLRAVRGETSRSKPLTSCPTCHQPIQSGTVFCPSCGASLAAAAQQVARSAQGPTCDQCGAPIRSGAQFCTSCGAAQSATSEQPKPEAPAPPQAPAVPTCPACGAARKPGAAFCAECGAQLPAP
jgi:uncharacterized Zn finger protein (UPF0148 family)